MAVHAAQGAMVAHACLSREVGNKVERQGEAMPGRRSSIWEGGMRTGRRSLKEPLGGEAGKS